MACLRIILVRAIICEQIARWEFYFRWHHFKLTKEHIIETLLSIQLNHFYDGTTEA